MVTLKVKKVGSVIGTKDWFAYEVTRYGITMIDSTAEAVAARMAEVCDIKEYKIKLV